MAYHVFAAAGLPAPRCNFATVAVNGENLGLYVHVESMKNRLFGSQFFRSKRQSLRRDRQRLPSSSGAALCKRKPTRTAADWSDIDAVVAALQDPSPAGLEALADIIDIDRFLTFWAVEVLIGHWDGYAGNRNNFYVYREPDAPFVFIPWGADQVFTSIDSPFDDFVSPPSVDGARGHRPPFIPRQRDASRLCRLASSNCSTRSGMKKNCSALPMRWRRLSSSTRWPKGAPMPPATQTECVNSSASGVAAILADLDPEPAAWPWPAGLGRHLLAGNRRV